MEKQIQGQKQRGPKISSRQIAVMKEISKISCFENNDPCRNVAWKSVNLKITSYIDEVASVFGACNFANFTD